MTDRTNRGPKRTIRFEITPQNFLPTEIFTREVLYYQFMSDIADLIGVSGEDVEVNWVLNLDTGEIRMGTDIEDWIAQGTPRENIINWERQTQNLDDHFGNIFDIYYIDDQYVEIVDADRREVSPKRLYNIYEKMATMEITPRNFRPTEKLTSEWLYFIFMAGIEGITGAGGPFPDLELLPKWVINLDHEEIGYFAYAELWLVRGTIPARIILWNQVYMIYHITGNIYEMDYIVEKDPERVIRTLLTETPMILGLGDPDDHEIGDRPEGVYWKTRTVEELEADLEEIIRDLKVFDEHTNMLGMKRAVNYYLEKLDDLKSEAETTISKKNVQLNLLRRIEQISAELLRDEPVE